MLPMKSLLVALTLSIATDPALAQSQGDFVKAFAG